MATRPPAEIDTHSGIIAWFARNSVAANLLMIGIIVIGLISALTIRKQMFPQIENTWLNIYVSYPGAAPPEVEEAITVKLEEALVSVQGLERIITRSNRGSAQADLKVLDSYDPEQVLDEVKSAVDSISSFPDGMERESFYAPVERGFEREIAKRLAYWAKLRQERQEREE